MDAETQALIAERTRALPQGVKEALARVDVGRLLADIVQANSLRIDQGSALETETVLTILGVEPAGSFVGNIERELHIPHDTAAKIAADVNEQIFKALRLEMSSTSESHTTPIATAAAPMNAGATPPPHQPIIRPIEKGSYPKGADPYREPVN